MLRIKHSFLLLGIMSNILFSMEQNTEPETYMVSEQDKQLIQEIIKTQKNQLDATTTARHLHVSLLLSNNQITRVSVLSHFASNLNCWYAKLNKDTTNKFEIAAIADRIKNCENNILQYIISCQQLENVKLKTELNIPFDKDNIQFTKYIYQYQDLAKEYEKLTSNGSDTL